MFPTDSTKRLTSLVLIVLIAFLPCTSVSQEAPASKGTDDDVTTSKSIDPTDVPSTTGLPAAYKDSVIVSRPLEIEIGKPAWEVSFPSTIDWQLETLLGILFVSTGDRLYGLDGMSGRVLWDHPIRVEQFSVQEVARTNVVLLLDVEQPGSGAASPSDQHPNGGSELDTISTYSMAIDQLTGAKLWTGPAITDEDAVLVYPMYDRQQVFLATVDRDFATNVGKAVASNLTFGLVKGSKPMGHACVVDVVDGTVEWCRTLTDPDNLEFRITSDDFLEFRPKNVVDISLDNGEVRWKMDTKDKATEEVSGKLLIAAGRISAYDLRFEKKGELKKGILWKSKPTKAVGEITDVVAHGDRLYFAGNKGFACLASDTGDVIWDQEKDGKGRPMTVKMSPDGSYVLGILERHVKLGVAKVHDAGSIRLMVLSSATGDLVGEFPADDDEQKYLETGEIKTIRWVDDSTIFLESEIKQLGISREGGALVLKWKRDRPPKPEFPEDIEAEKALKKKKRQVVALAFVASLVGAGALGSDFGEMVLIAGTVAVAAALALQLKQNEVYGESDFNDPESRVAYERFKMRKESFDTRKKTEVLKAEQGYIVTELDLQDGSLKEIGKAPTEGRAHVDTIFRLLYQRDWEERRILRAYVVEGYSDDLAGEFSM